MIFFYASILCKINSRSLINLIFRLYHPLSDMYLFTALLPYAFYMFHKVDKLNLCQIFSQDPLLTFLLLSFSILNYIFLGELENFLLIFFRTAHTNLDFLCQTNEKDFLERKVHKLYIPYSRHLISNHSLFLVELLDSYIEEFLLY